MNTTTRLLVLAAEDFTGLWQAVLELPDEPQPEDGARRALGQLFSDGLIQLYEGGDLATSEPAILDRELTQSALGPGPQWVVPGPEDAGPWIYFAVSDTGLEWLQEHHWGHSQ